MFKLYLIFMALLAFTYIKAEDTRTSDIVESFWIKQKLDHFNNSETGTWKMRFMSNSKFYKYGGPLFVYVNGVNPVNAYNIDKGILYNMAKRHNAYLISTEHRFYGKSWPVDVMTNENMEYLNVKQALADLAHLIRTLKITVPGMENSKVILRGDEYGGSVAIWFKKLYPELADGCWASSAPVLAQIDLMGRQFYGEYLRSRAGDSCYDRISNNIEKLEKMLTENKTAELRNLLNICENFDGSNELDVANLFAEIYDTFASGLYLNPEMDWLSPLCSTELVELKNFTDFLNYYMDAVGDDECNDFTYQYALKPFKNIQFGDDILRQWPYQLCNEFGWFSPSTLQQPFGNKVSLKLFTSVCKDSYGDKFTQEYIEKKINETNEYFGGLNQEIENVYLTYDECDVWRTVGIPDEGISSIIPSTRQVSPYITNNDDQEAKLSSKELIFTELLDKWLQA